MSWSNVHLFAIFSLVQNPLHPTKRLGGICSLSRPLSRGRMSNAKKWLALFELWSAFSKTRMIGCHSAKTFVKYSAEPKNEGSSLLSEGQDHISPALLFSPTPFVSWQPGSLYEDEGQIWCLSRVIFSLFSFSLSFSFWIFAFITIKEDNTDMVLARRIVTRNVSPRLRQPVYTRDVVTRAWVVLREWATQLPRLATASRNILCILHKMCSVARCMRSAALEPVWAGTGLDSGRMREVRA